MTRTAASLAGFAALCGFCLAAPTIPAAARARNGLDCQSGGQAEPKSLAFVVSRVEFRAAGEFILTFENGEVWQQADRSKKINIERGEQVVIRRSSTGKFTLVSRGGESVRVERVH